MLTENNIEDVLKSYLAIIQHRGLSKKRKQPLKFSFARADVLGTTRVRFSRIMFRIPLITKLTTCKNIRLVFKFLSACKKKSIWISRAEILVSTKNAKCQLLNMCYLIFTCRLEKKGMNHFMIFDSREKKYSMKVGVPRVLGETLLLSW